jgi:hypothetical protein
MAPAEWLDMGGGLVAASLMVPSQGRLVVRLFDLATGACLRASALDLHADEAAVCGCVCVCVCFWELGGSDALAVTTEACRTASARLLAAAAPWLPAAPPHPDVPPRVALPPVAQLQLLDHEAAMVATRSGEAGGMVVATCALFDTRVFLWRLRDHALPAAPAPAPPHAAAPQDAAAWAAARAAAWDAAAAAPPPAPGGDAEGGGGSEPASELRHVYTTADEEPVVDLSISHTGQRLLVVGMEHVSAAAQGWLACWLGWAARWEQDWCCTGASQPCLEP